MERLLGQFDHNKTNFYSDSSHRMKERPYSIQSGEGRGHEDFGSSFAPSQPSRPMQGTVITSKVKSATPHPIITNLESGPDSSDDELLLSGSPVRKRVVRGKATVSTSQEINLAPNGHPYHPDFLPNKKLPSFKKNKKDLQAPTSFPNPDDSQELSRPISDDLPPQVLPHKPTATRRRVSGKSTTARVNESSSPPANSKTHRKPVGKSVSKKPAPPSPLAESESPKVVSRRVRPRPHVKAGSSIIRGQSPEATPRASRQPQPFPLPKISLYSGGSSRGSDVSPPRQLSREPSAAKKENANVPISTLKGKAGALSRQHTAPFPMSPPGKLNLPPKQPPKPFPLHLHSSKQDFDRSDAPENFPVPSPLTSPVQPPVPNKGKGPALAPHQCEGNINGLALIQDRNGALQPFPMKSRETKATTYDNHQSPPNSVRSKRSSDDSDGECERKVKKHKEGNPGKLATLIFREEDHMEDNSMELDRVADPSTICPYCDEPLPRNPTPQLKNLLATAKRRSHADPRPRNPRGLKAPLGIYISACQRHHFETHIFPEAMDKGWPRSIDFKKVPKRIEGMKHMLEAIIVNAGNCSDDEDCRDVVLKRPAVRSVFWSEIKKEIRKQGSRTVIGVKGQFASFEKTQPGYYGELGSLIIHQSLYNLFPFSSFDVSSIAPFTPAEFIQRVLVPEAAVGLIMQDLHMDRDDAIVALRESSQYGVAMFPDTSTSKSAACSADDDDDVADRIVMERAKARRLEIEQEEKIEEQMWKEEQAKRRSKAQIDRKEKARLRAEQLKISKENASREVSETSEPEHRCRRPKKIPKAGSRIAIDSETDSMSVDSLASRRSTSRTRIIHRTASAKSVSSSMQFSDDSDVEIVDETQQPRTKPSSRRVASRSVARSNDVGFSDPSLPKTRRLKSLASDDLDVHVHVGDTPPRPIPEVCEESTPRPRWSKAPTVIHPALGLPTDIASNRLPLQAARSRSVTSAMADVWRKNLAGGGSEAEDSDSSQEDQSSRNVHHWLLSQSSSSSTS